MPAASRPETGSCWQPTPKRSLLVAYTMAALDSMILAYHAATPGQVAQ